MRNLVFALVGSALLLIGLAATTSARKPGVPGPPDEGAIIIIAGVLSCTDYSGRSEGMILLRGVVGIPHDWSEISFRRPSGTCVETLASLTAQLPSPLCSTGVGDIGPGFTFVCSGGARSVVETVAAMLKSAVGP